MDTAVREAVLGHCQTQIFTLANDVDRLSRENDLPQALETLMFMGDAFVQMEDGVGGEEDLENLTNSYCDVIRASEAFYPQVEGRWIPCKFIDTLKESKRTTENESGLWQQAHKDATDSLIEFLGQAAAATKTEKLTKSAANS